MNGNAILTEGFTMIELLVVVAIIGVLAAIATPVLRSQQGSATDAAAITDLSHAKSAEVAYAMAHDATATTSLSALAQYRYSTSEGVTGTTITLGATQSHFCIEATSESSRTFKITWDSHAKPGACTAADAA